MRKKVEKNKFNLMVIIMPIILIVLILLAIILVYFISKPSNEIPLKNNDITKDFVDEEDLPIISVILPNENEENNYAENTIIESNNNVNTNVSSSTIQNNNANTNSNSNANVNSNTNQSSSSKPNTNQNTNSNSNTNLNSSSSTNNNSNNWTNSEVITPPVQETKPYKVKTETSKDLTKSETKYGVVINTYTTSTYDLYSDGSKKNITSYNEIEYDRSNYHATTSELLPEAKLATGQYSSMINQVFENVNLYRKEANKNSVNSVASRNNLSLDESLCVAACARAIEMAYSSKFSHTRPNGSTCFSLLKEMGITYMTAGENIAYGYTTASSASEGWKKSKDHYNNMISPNFSKIGIGLFKVEETYYWVQLFN